MSAKRAFFGIFQKLVVVCCAIFFGFANAFSANLPAGYTELEYIESTGTQWIDTGISFAYSDVLRIVADMQYTDLPSGASQYFGIYGGAYFGVTNSSWSVGGNAQGTANTTRHVFDFSTTIGTNQVQTLKVDNVSYANTRNNQNGRVGVLNTVSGTYFNHAKLYSVKIYKNSSLTFDGIPAKYGNVVGMYDTVNNVFYTNQGTGTFTAGPAKCRNLFDKNNTNTADGYIANAYLNSNGVEVSSNSYAISVYIPVEGDTKYYYSINGTDGQVATGHSAPRVAYYDANKVYISSSNGLSGGASFQTPVSCKYIRVPIYKEALEHGIQLEQGTTATDYVPFCASEIKIATTAYNTARFSPVVNDLNSTVATIRDIVTNTINQTAAIASLQADKQTRPDENCPAGKKCLLVETEENGVIVPHWYEIIENIYGLPAGYTALEYIQSDGASYLIVPYRVNNKTVFYCRYNELQNTLSAAIIFGVTDAPNVSKANNGILRLTGINRMGWGDSTSGSIIDVSAPKAFNTWYEVLYDQNKLYQDNVLYATSATQPSTSWTANYDLGIFARNGPSVTFPSKAKISSVWAKENGEYKINLVPAKRNSDNVIGMYDGTGTFTAGPEI